MRESTNKAAISIDNESPVLSVFNPLKTIKPSSDTLYPFSNILHRSLDIKTILSTSLNQLNASFGVTAMGFNPSASSLTWEVGQTKSDHPRIIESFILETEQACIGSLTLSLLQTLSRQDYQTLCDSLEGLIYPLRNALEHYAVLQQTLTDPLTGCGNRLALDSFLIDQSNYFERYGHPYSLLMIDIDHFKSINDSFGHCIGDQVLRKTAKTLKDNLRISDRVFRYGGEEFLAVLTHTDANGCQILAERIHKAIGNMEYLSATDQRITVTISIGCATSSDQSHDYKALIQQADMALYVAKRKGRNRIEQKSLEKGVL